MTKDKYNYEHFVLLSEKRQDHYDRKILLVAISAALLLSSFVTGSQFIQPSLAQGLAQKGEQAKERVGGAVGQLTDGNQTGNQSGGILGQLGDQAKSLIPTTRPQPMTTTNGTQEANQTSSVNVVTGESPNILLIVADDLGWSDLKPYGGDIISPNLGSAT